MIIVTANVSGLQKAIKDGFFELDHIKAADVLCLQETSCVSAEKLVDKHLEQYEVLAANRMAGEHGGVAILSRLPIETEIASEETLLDNRGQFVAGIIGRLAIASVYVTLDNPRSQREALTEKFARIWADHPLAALCGDFNTFRGPQDSYRWHEAKKRQEYGADYEAVAWMNEHFRNEVWNDALRADSKASRLYTRWHTDGHFSRNEGTRLDYQLTTPALTRLIVAGSSRVVTSHRRGQHAQVSIAYDITA